MFKVLIIGGEETDNYEFFQSKCAYFLKEKGKSGCGIMIYTVGDDFVDKFAKKFNIDVRYFVPDWKNHKQKALTIRNQKIFEDCDALIAFSKNTKDVNVLIKIAKEKNIPTRVVDMPT